MSISRSGILHPGQVGITVAISARNSGSGVFWVSVGRSAATAKRAAQGGLEDAGTLSRLCEICPVILSVCPPEFAERLAEEVAACSYRGLFVDASAISPERTRRIGGKIESNGARFVEGGIGRAAALKMKSRRRSRAPECRPGFIARPRRFFAASKLFRVARRRLREPFRTSWSLHKEARSRANTLTTPANIRRGRA
jgi:hypothetical protein